MDYRLAPVEPGRLAIRTAAGPSVFNPAAAGLLQVAVKAGGPARRAVPATHLTVALDISASMGWDGRLDRVRRGLARFWGHLGADDRFSLVVFHDEAVLAADQCGREEAASVLQVVDNLHAYGNGDLGAGIRAGVAAAMETEANRPLARRLVLVTDRDLPQLLVTSAKNVLQEAHGHGLTFAVVDMSDTAEADTRLAQLARQVGGTLSRARSAEDVRWALLETLTGEPSAAAHETRLQVAFNPRSVAAYRVVGHAATAAGGLLPGGVECDLRQGQEASLLFEVWLRPNDENEVAVAKLRWRNPASSQMVEVPAQRISRLQFATSFEGSPIPLQAAAIAAETAEILRQGYAFEVPSETVYRYRPKPRTLHEVLATARRANPDLAARPEFQRYVSLVEDAQRLYAARRAETAKAGVRGLVAGRWREAAE
jgi:Ca-activated chloride channel family protein